jgi:hypothetical protein
LLAGRRHHFGFLVIPLQAIVWTTSVWIRYLFSFSSLFVPDLRLFIRTRIVSIPGLRIRQNVPHMAWMTQWLRSKFAPKSAGPRFIRATQSRLGHCCLASRPRFLPVYSDAAYVSRERLLSYAHDNSCRNSGRVTPLAASAWIDHPAGNSIGLCPVLVVRTRDRPRNTPARFTLQMESSIPTSNQASRKSLTAL